jgi:hypothetical protein
MELLLAFGFAAAAPAIRARFCFGCRSSATAKSQSIS